jgi:tetratricopeptide (TPR) repeat protein
MEEAVSEPKPTVIAAAIDFFANDLLFIKIVFNFACNIKNFIMKKAIVTSIIVLFYFLGHSQNANEHYIKGMDLFDHKKYNDAIAEFSSAIKANSNFKEALFKRGVCFEFLEDYEKAVKDFTVIITIDPANAQAHYNRGLAYKELNEYTKAITDFSTTIKFKPLHKYAYYNRALSKLALDDVEGACVDLSKSADLGIERASEIFRYTCK